MPGYKAPVDDVMFLLSDVLHIDRYNNLPGFAEVTPDLVEAVLAEAAKFSEDVLTPLNHSGDKEGCRRHDDGSVTTPAGFKGAAYRQTDSTVYCVAEGSGSSRIGEGMFPWKARDIFVVPAWCSVSHAAAEDAVLFSFSDRPAQKALGLWREQVPVYKS